jgi:Phosphomannomutase
MGAEESGGLSVFGHVPEKDGILVGLLAAEILASTGKTFEELDREAVEKYGIMISERIDVKITPKEKERILADLHDYQPKSIAGEKVDTIDEKEGKKIILEDGSWILIRPSGTEPLVRVYVEAPNEKRRGELHAEVLSALGLQAD